MRTTWDNTEVHQTIFHNSYYSRKYVLIRSIGLHFAILWYHKKSTVDITGSGNLHLQVPVVVAKFLDLVVGQSLLRLVIAFLSLREFLQNHSFCDVTKLRNAGLPMVQIQTDSNNQIFCYTRYITPKGVASLQGPSPRHCASGQHSFFKRNVAAVASCWQHYVRFDRSEIWTSDLSLQRRMRHRSINWSVRQTD